MKNPIIVNRKTHRKDFVMKKKLLICLTAAFMAVSFAACGKTAESTDQTKDTETTAEEQEADAEKSENKPVTELPQLEGVQKGDTIATIHTNKGDIKVWFFPEYAPKAVENFVTHAKEGYYDNVIFHRVINDFMIQGGDPDGTGMGGESIWGAEFENEVTYNLRNFRGALCMANAGPDTNGSQFYIVQNKDIGDTFKQQLAELDKSEKIGDGSLTAGDVFTDEVIAEYTNNGGYPSLDMGYTVFGQVYEGMDVVDAIAAVETDDNDKPLEDVVITGIEVGTY